MAGVASCRCVAPPPPERAPSRAARARRARGCASRREPRPVELAVSLATLIRRVALRVATQAGVASLHGEPWVAFLTEGAESDSAFAARSLAISSRPPTAASAPPRERRTSGSPSRDRGSGRSHDRVRAPLGARGPAPPLARAPSHSSGARAGEGHYASPSSAPSRRPGSRARTSSRRGASRSPRSCSPGRCWSVPPRSRNGSGRRRRSRRRDAT